jgi:two-component system phosphate regulon sensor histidine kinase PhoR
MSVFKKSLLTLSLSALGLSAALVISVLAFMNSLYYEVNAAGLRNTAKALLGAIGEDRTAAYFADNNSGFSFRDSAYRLTLINPDGEVKWDSHAENELVNHLGREEVDAALEGREGSARRNSLSTGTRQIYSALPVLDANGRIAGVFRLSLIVPSFWQRISAAALPFLIFAGFLALAAFAAIFVFSRSLSDSLKRLVDIAADAVSGGSRPGFSPGQNTDAGISDAGLSDAGEFLTLEKALRNMAAELKTRLEQAQAESSRLEAVLNGMSEAVFAMDSALLLHLVNPSARRLFNLGGRDLSNTGSFGGLSLLEATRSTELEQAARTALTEGRSLETELRLRGGQERRFLVFAAPLAAANNAPSGIVMVLQDITRLIRLEEVRRDFVANVSHELRTPIQLIKGFSETLLDTPLDDNEQLRHFISIIRKNAETMENLTNDLLILASLESGDSYGEANDPHGMEEQRLAPLFAEAVSSVEPGAQKKQIEIMVNCPADLAAKLHGSFIIQALINLLDNGIKYSPERSRIRAEAKAEKGELILEVRDEGIGIPAEHLPRIFERFYRVDRSRRHGTANGANGAGADGAGTDGTGLGLSIVRHIALLHQGNVEVESRAGEGSVFRIRIPRALLA